MTRSVGTPELGGRNWEVGTGRSEVTIKTFATPCGFDDQNGRVQFIANGEPKIEFGTDAVLAAVSDGQFSISVEALDPYVTSFHLFAVAMEVGEPGSRSRIVNLLLKESQLCLALHVRLPSQNKNPHGSFVNDCHGWNTLANQPNCG